MTERKLYCVNDISHADFQWSSRSEFFHLRKYDCNGAVMKEWTAPVKERYQGNLRCAVCGGEAFVAGKGLTDMGEKIVACDFLGRCKDFFKDENLNNLEKLLAALDASRHEAAARRLAKDLADDPAGRALFEKYGLGDLFS